MEEEVGGREQKYNTLRDFLLGRPNRRASEDLARFLFKRILSHVENLHEHGKIHKNLNLETIFVTANGEIKVGDYLHPDSENSSKSFCHFHAPEMWGENGQVYPATDIWSLGIILFVMVCGVYPFLGKDETEIWFSIQRGFLHIPPFASASCAELIRAILNPSVGLRPTIAAIKNHSWIQLPSSLSHSLFINDQNPSNGTIPLNNTNLSIPSHYFNAGSNLNSSINSGRSISFDAIPSPSRDGRRRSLQETRNEQTSPFSPMNLNTNDNVQESALDKPEEPWLNPEHKGRRAFSGDTLVQSAIQKFIQEKNLGGLTGSLNNNNFYAPIIGNEPSNLTEQKVKSEEQSPTNRSSSPLTSPEDLMSNSPPNHTPVSAPSNTAQNPNEQNQNSHHPQTIQNSQITNSNTPAELTATLNSTNPELRKLLEQVKFNNPQNLFNPPAGSPLMTSSGSFRLSKKLKNANKRMKMAHSSSNNPITTSTTPSPSTPSPSPSPSSNSPTEKSKSKSKAAQPKASLPPQTKQTISQSQINQFNMQQRQQQMQSHLVQQQQLQHQQHQLRFLQQQQMNESGINDPGRSMIQNITGFQPNISGNNQNRASIVGASSNSAFHPIQIQHPYHQYQMQNNSSVLPNSNPSLRNVPPMQRTNNLNFPNQLHSNLNQSPSDQFQHIRLQDPLFLSEQNHGFGSFDANSAFADMGDKSYTALLESVELADLDGQLVPEPSF
eukprot:TRINITY_DN3525_c0_g2_i1.p1 TRINITY_DN3525_c0_g2~~TRINITY_DN3525_c0_g2_i1.p1  ORF type:complete len:722 (+),score=149.11 TRINITY_DN3525_c0_g2_i1:264-2429(+)